MIKKIQTTLLAMMAVFTLSVGVLTPASVYAVDPGSEIQKGVNGAGGGGAVPLRDRLKDIVNVLLFILGAIAVIMIVVGGIRYTLSGGDSSQTKAAKDTVLYSVVGLIVAILAYAIVNFVLNSFA